MRNNFYTKLLEYGIKNEKGFNFDYIIADKKLSLTEEEKKIVEKYIKDAFNNSHLNFAGGASYQETPFLCIHEGNGHLGYNSKYTLTFDANFKYIDYLELREARSAAKKAFFTAIIAIILAFVTLIISFNNSVKLDESQFDQIIKLLLFR